MKDLIAELRASIAATLLLAVLCCGIYRWPSGRRPGDVPDKANGSWSGSTEGRGSALIAQGFAGRPISTPPSAAGQGYDAIHSGGRTSDRRRKN